MSRAESPRSRRWSAHSLRILQECGEKYRRAILEGERSAPSSRQIRGRVVHEVARGTFRRKLQREPVVTVEEARDTAADEFEAQWTGPEGVLLSEDESSAGPDKAKAQAKDFAVDLSGYHAGTVAPKLEPLHVERHVIVRPRDTDIELHAIYDLVTAGEVIRDLKTAEKAPQRDAADTSQQLTVYALIRQAETGGLPESLALDYLVRTPVKAEKSHVVLSTTRAREDVTALVRRINTAVRAVEAGIFVPANPESWWCSPQWCQFYDSCPYVRRGTSRPRT